MTTNQTTTNNVSELNKFEYNGQTVYQFQIGDYSVVYIKGFDYYDIINTTTFNKRKKEIAIPQGFTCVAHLASAKLKLVIKQVTANVNEATRLGVCACRIGKSI